MMRVGATMVSTSELRVTMRVMMAKMMRETRALTMFDSWPRTRGCVLAPVHVLTGLEALRTMEHNFLERCLDSHHWALALIQGDMCCKCWLVAVTPNRSPVAAWSATKPCLFKAGPTVTRKAWHPTHPSSTRNCTS